jgi:hypothetical protein
MYLTVYYTNGIVEEFALSLKSANDLIKRLIESKSVNKIMSAEKVIYEAPLHDFTPEFKKLKMLYDEADKCFFVAELDVAGGIGYFPVDPMKKRTPENIYKRNRIVKGNNFILAKEKIQNIEKEYIKLAKENANKLTEEERKLVAKWRYKFKKMIASCDYYINIFHGQKSI